MSLKNAYRRLSLARPLEPGAAWREISLELPDGYRTSAYVHDPPADSALPPVVYLHGIQSHPGWFIGSASALAARGHRVLQVTRRGSGDNEFDRGHARSAEQLLDDVGAACLWALKDAPAPGVHLVGVSWGGKLAACYAARPQGEVPLASVTLIAPGLVPKIKIGTGTKLAIAMSLLSRPRRLFEIPLCDVELFTDNEAMREYLRRDRCRLLRATGRFLYVSRRLDQLLRRSPAGCLKMPVTLILAERDRIIDNAATRRLAERLAGGRLEVKTLPGAHTLEFEPHPEPFYQALAEALRRGRACAS